MFMHWRKIKRGRVGDAIDPPFLPLTMLHMFDFRRQYGPSRIRKDVTVRRGHESHRVSTKRGRLRLRTSIMALTNVLVVMFTLDTVRCDHHPAVAAGIDGPTPTFLPRGHTGCRLL
ncbi:hypothetical protein BDZ45DRAFT_432570 [Acephala macrosclerotiorum]|nr:hypothetical protein BDZ45DRAFT_432570 [Acephala macrosclerotiorum]